MQLCHHAFWDCPVAYAVRQQLNQALLPSQSFSEPNIWLVQAPPGAQQPMWDVVAPAALSAMDVGRHTMGFRPCHAATPPLLDVQQCVQAGCTRGTSAFWLSLHNLAATSLSRRGRGWERLTPSCSLYGNRRVSVDGCHYNGVCGRGNMQQ
jgi:hypothetical protein